MKGFKKCCVSNAVDETDDNMLWYDTEEDVNIKSEYEIDKGIDYENGDIDTNE